MAHSKGISPLIGYVLSVLMAIIVIGAVAVLVTGFYDTIIKDEVKRELTQVAAQTSSKVTDIYYISKASRASPGNSSAILLGEEQLNLPQKVASKSYKLTLLSASQVASQISNVTVNGGNVSSVQTAPNGKIVAQTTEDPVVEVDYDVPSIDVDMQGSSGNPSNATLRYYRYNPNGTVIDTILMGDYTLLGQVTAVS